LQGFLRIRMYKPIKLNKMKTNFKKEYRNLEMKVLRTLRDAVDNSNIDSKFVQTKAIKVNIFDYVELIIINDRLTFLDSRGLHYSVLADCTLEDLIDIINEL